MPRQPQQPRYRRCPNCKAILRASEFPRAIGTTFAVSGLQRRRCPECGHVAPLMGFPIVERPEGDS